MTVHALAWGLLHSLWQGALVGAVAEVTLRSLHRARPEVRYRVAGLLLAVQVAGFLATVALLSRPGAPVAPLGLAVPPSPWPLAVVAAWTVGVGVLGVRLAGGLLLVWRIRRRSIQAPPGWLARFEELQARLGLAGVELRLVPEGLVPMAVGVLRPAVLVPASLLVQLPSAQLEAVLLHELAHVRRLDWLVNLAQSGAELLLFHHPATWWLSARIRHERELCCDALAVAAAGSPLAYARALAELESRRALVTAPAVNGGDLMDRILRLLGTPRPPCRASWLWPAIVAGSLLGLASAAAVARTADDGDAVASAEPEDAEPEPEPERPTEPEDVGAKVLELLSDKLEQGAEALEENADRRHERREERKRAAVQEREREEVHHREPHREIVVRMTPHAVPPPPPIPPFDAEALARAMAEAEYARAAAGEVRRAELERARALAEQARAAAEQARAAALEARREELERVRAEADRLRAEAERMGLQALGSAGAADEVGCRTWRGGGTTVIVCRDGAADAGPLELEVVVPPMDLEALGLEAGAFSWGHGEAGWEAFTDAWADRGWQQFAEEWAAFPPVEPLPPLEPPEPVEPPAPPPPPAPIRPRRSR